MKTASAETSALIVRTHCSGAAARKPPAEIFGRHIQSIGNWSRAFENESRISPHAKGHRQSVFSDEKKVALTHVLRQQDIEEI